MKKWMFVSVLIVLIACVYIFIPSRLIISKIIKGNTSVNAAHRYLLDTSQWHKWWPRDQPEYTITGVFYNEVRFRISNDGDTSAGGALRIGGIGYDSLLMGGEYILPV